MAKHSPGRSYRRKLRRQNKNENSKYLQKLSDRMQKISVKPSVIRKRFLLELLKDEQEDNI